MPEYRKKVAAVIFNAQKEVLLGKYFWDIPNCLTHHDGINRTFPGGGVDEWESYKHAMLREIHEEVWLNKQHLKLTFEYKKMCFVKYTVEQKKRFKSKRWWPYKGKMQKFFFYYFLWEEKDINLTIGNEFESHIRIAAEEVHEYINPKLSKFINTRSLLYHINNYFENIS